MPSFLHLMNQDLKNVNPCLYQLHLMCIFSYAACIKQVCVEKSEKKKIFHLRGTQKL